ncbi:29387_t:CDS:10 [Gigaspora margarita]|uniref:29387_t:CDS:1 n=1 Tax=Gigaspora margarita TaxID=4874 RepID=A0ABM8W733_GIGMA|nr:29387_t:CDS:10 [Gigaspora margarita]
MGFDEELAKNHEVIIFDNRGIGESTVASYDDPITIELMAKDTIELVKHFGIKRFNLFGVSMGGMIALCVALNVPPDLKLEKLVIGAGFAQIKSYLKKYQEIEELCKLPEMNHPKSIQEQKNMLLSSENDLAKYFFKHPDELDKLDKIAEIIFKTNDKRPIEIYKRQWEAIKQCNLVSRLQTIKVPTLIIHGEDDELIPIQEGELLDREIPNTQFYRIPNVGHGWLKINRDGCCIETELDEWGQNKEKEIEDIPTRPEETLDSEAPEESNHKTLVGVENRWKEESKPKKLTGVEHAKIDELSSGGDREEMGVEPYKNRDFRHYQKSANVDCQKSADMKHNNNSDNTKDNESKAKKDAHEIFDGQESGRRRKDSSELNNEPTVDKIEAGGKKVVRRFPSEDLTGSLAD